MNNETQFNKAIEAFDAYNANDPTQETENGALIAKELLYAKRMTKKLSTYFPEADECLQLAARSQHIGRWEIARINYSMDKKGYFQWRNELKKHHAFIASQLLRECGYDQENINEVVSLLKKDFNHAGTQVLEDVICLVFLEYYVDEFAAKYNDAKVVDILRKTAKKMSARALQAVDQIPLSTKMKTLVDEAVSS